jgi:hypothetical protein
MKRRGQLPAHRFIGDSDKKAGAAGEGPEVAAFLRGVDLIVLGTTFQNRALF